jgi:acyl-CoA thioesterase I
MSLDGAINLKEWIVKPTRGRSGYTLHKIAIFIAAMVTVLSFGQTSKAATINIVSLGASNTAGNGVGTQQSFTGQLEAMLRAKGYDVSIANAGINGDTSAGMLARLGSAVPDGTQLVILGASARNDDKNGIGAQHAANIGAIVSQLRARHIKVIMVPKLSVPRQADGQHFSVEGHTKVAASLLPLVIAAIGRR